jgi:hypothetical protein
MNGFVRTRELDIVESAPGCNKTKLQERGLAGAFHHLKQAGEALRAKLREQFLFIVPLLQVTEHPWLLHFRTELHPAAAARQTCRHDDCLQSLR